MKMKKSILMLMLGGATLFASCDIERFPSYSMSDEQIKNDPAGNLDALLNGMYAQLKTWSDPMHRCGEYAGDNIVIRGQSTDAFFEFISYSRTPNNYRLQNFWDYGYKAIAQASNIIKMVPEGSDADVNNSLGECYYVRGMMYFYLCRAYGRPYYQAPEKNLGVPIVNGTPDDILDLKLDDRATVEKTYEQAISDLKKAEELMSKNRGAAYASKAAAQAMLSRVYLYMSGTYESPNREYAQLAVDYANKVITNSDYSLLPREEFMKYNTIVPENNPEAIFVVKRVASEFSGYDHYYGIGGMYSNIGGMGWGEMYASEKYIDLLNETGRNDWRAASKRIVDARANFIEPTYTDDNKEVFRFIYVGSDNNKHYAQFTTTHTGNKVTCVDKDKNSYDLTPVAGHEADEYYTINYNGKTYQGMLDNYITINREYPQFYIVKCSREGEDSQLHSPVISRLGEIYLNRAEALAKLGRYDEALADLNTIRNRSIVNGGYPAGTLNANNAFELIDKERQLELAYQAERSYDVFRNGHSLTRDYPGPHNQHEEVKTSDFRVTYYIPQNAINAYPGTLTQNPTDDSGVIMN